MIKVQVHLEQEQIDQLTAHLEHFGKGAFPETNNAFKAATRTIQKAWQGWAMGGELDGAEPIKNPSTSLMQSIKVDQFGDFQAEIYTENPYMAQVQSGRAPYDLKETHPYGKKSRVSKQGIPYLIVPFRWGTPNDKGGKRAHWGNFIETDIHNFVKNRKKFSVSRMNGGSHFEKNYSGEDIERPEYDWGDRYNGEGNINGMVAFPDIRKRGSEYFTFRIISAKSPENSWKVPAIPANDVVGALEKQYEPEVSKAIEEGFKADLGME